MFGSLGVFAFEHKPRVTACICNFVTRRVRKMSCEFEARLGYTASSRVSWATQSCLKERLCIRVESRQEWDTNVHDIAHSGKWSEGVYSPTTKD